ncbi:MAG: PIN domain-containing protein [Bauldia sp.]|nr:PIN domain-containing protein [Bauldia sp.]
MTAIYLLDTSTLGDLVRNPRGAVYDWLGVVADDAVATSVVAAAELRFGAARKRSPSLSKAVEGVLLRIGILPLDSPADETCATLRADLERRGRPLSGNDLLIAAHALSLGMVLVTADEAFGGVPGLAVENWLVAP